MGLREAQSSSSTGISLRVIVENSLG